MTHQVQDRPVSIWGRTYQVGTAHGNAYIIINWHEGRIFEVFSQVGKSGACDRANLEGVARLVSVLLRANVLPEAIIEQLKGIQCDPNWSNGRQYLSIPDALAQTMEQALKDGPPDERAGTPVVVKPHPPVLDESAEAEVPEDLEDDDDHAESEMEVDDEEDPEEGPIIVFRVRPDVKTVHLLDVGKEAALCRKRKSSRMVVGQVSRGDRLCSSCQIIVLQSRRLAYDLDAVQEQYPHLAMVAVPVG